MSLQISISNSIKGSSRNSTGVAPSNVIAPLISGVTVVGYSLSTTNGSWIGESPITYTYQWYRGATLITGETSSSYTLVNADEGQSMTCVVTATNAYGFSSATSNSLTVVSLLLDLYTSSAVAYSLRQLRTAYTGAAIRVRRSSDNAEQDINFVSGNLDTASLLTFCGAGNGFITTWYDQSGNANNANQPTLLASQAQIVSSGSLILDADTSKITSTWTADRYDLTTGISTNTKYLSISMFRRGATTADVLTHLGNSAATSPNTLLWTGTGSSYSVRNSMPTLLAFQNVSTTGRCIITSLKNAANLKVAYRNGVQLTSTATEAPAAGTLNVFGQVSTTNFTSGQYQEYIYWNSEQSANRTAIENNIKTYWNAY